MTPEQIASLLQIISNLPVQALLLVVLYTLYRDERQFRKENSAWAMTQLSAYMERDREIVSNVAPKVETASKWTRVNGLNPPAPG